MNTPLTHKFAQFPVIGDCEGVQMAKNRFWKNPHKSLAKSSLSATLSLDDSASHSRLCETTNDERGSFH